jgi:putative SOS response-associated peptidase YedK
MCGRFALNATPNDVQALFGYTETPNFPPRGNISPTDPIAIVTQEGRDRHFKLVRWGLLPAWLKEPEGFPVLFNARGETIGSKPTFKSASRHRRCLIPADAFYEWAHTGKTKIPHRIRKPDSSLFAIAGLWEPYAHANGSEIDTATIVTTDANGLISALHHRMPVIIPESQFSNWLDTQNYSLDAAMHLVRPAADNFFMTEAFDPRTGAITLPSTPASKIKKPEQQSLF